MQQADCDQETIVSFFLSSHSRWTVTGLTPCLLNTLWIVAKAREISKCRRNSLCIRRASKLWVRLNSRICSSSELELQTLRLGECWGYRFPRRGVPTVIFAEFPCPQHHIIVKWSLWITHVKVAVTNFTAINRNTLNVNEWKYFFLLICIATHTREVFSASFSPSE